MSNKPLLFIETVQTKISEDRGQMIYDSRVHKKTEEVYTEEVTQVEQKPNEVLMDEKTKEKSNKLMHQINLLDKRAKQEHYVYIEIKTNEESYTGYFKGLNENKITLSEESEIKEIAISDIDTITILKV